MMSDQFNKLTKIMKILRSKEGCPWDKEQTHDSIKSHIVEETYELMEAIDEDNTQKIEEELGDILFLIVFHAQIAAENSHFTIDDVIKTVCEKMVQRHPHVFGDKKVSTVDQVRKSWEKIKQKEKKRTSQLDGIPQSLPALLRALKIQKRAAYAGFDWEKIEDVISKLNEECAEFTLAYKKNKTSEITEEFGDVLFTYVNIARFLRINPEESLHKTNQKFLKRFRYIEREASKRGRNLEDMHLDEIDSLWEKSKNEKK